MFDEDVLNEMEERIEEIERAMQLMYKIFKEHESDIGTLKDIVMKEDEEIEC